MAMNPPADRQRPYAAAANVIAVLRRVRARNLPDRIDNDFLRVAGVPENVFGRVTNALRFLGLIGPDDRPTDLLRSISAAPEQEYRDLLAGGSMRHTGRTSHASTRPRTRRRRSSILHALSASLSDVPDGHVVLGALS